MSEMHTFDKNCGCALCEAVKAAADKNILDRDRFADTPEHKSTVLVCFESGHYKKLHGKWKGDTIWTHWIKPDGKSIHINKDKVEYYEEL